MSKEWNPFLKEDLSPEELISVKCPKCDNTIFDQFFKIYKIPAEKTFLKKEKYVQMPVYVCANCQEILDSENKNDN